MTKGIFFFLFFFFSFLFFLTPQAMTSDFSMQMRRHCGGQKVKPADYLTGGRRLKMLFKIL